MAKEKKNTEKTDLKTDENGKPIMHVKVHGPYKIYYDGPANSITAENLTGPFDVLPQHHNFMTLLSECDVVVRLGEKEETVPIQRGVMHVKADEVIVFLDV